MEEPCVRPNGSTNLGDILSLKLNDATRGDWVGFRTTVEV